MEGAKEEEDEEEPKDEDGEGSKREVPNADRVRDKDWDTSQQLPHAERHRPSPTRPPPSQAFGSKLPKVMDLTHDHDQRSFTNMEAEHAKD